MKTKENDMGVRELPERYIDVRIRLESEDSLQTLRDDIEMELRCCWHLLEVIDVKEVSNDSNT